MLNIANHYRIANQHYMRYHLTQVRMSISSKSLQIINAGEDVEKKEPTYTFGGSVNWCSHYGEQYGGSLKN